MKAIGSVALVVLLAASSGAQAATTALKFGKLWDGRRTIPNAVVIVVDDKIQSVAANGAIPAGAAVIDLTRYTGMPGMIDAHTHMSFFWDPASGTNPLRQPPRPVAQTVTFAAANARRTLEAGVTTVRDLTGFDGADMQMRDAINRGAMVGPRMFVSGVGLRDNVIKNSPAEAGRLAKAVLDGGADWVKVYGSTGRANDLTGEATVSYDEMKSIVDTAHAMGRKVAIHSYGPNAARDAVRAGADTVEHATDMDDATIAEMARKRIWYIPTINHNQHYLERADTYQFSESDRANFRDYIARNVETARKAFRAGVRILPGSDAVFTAFGTNMEELRWLKRIGMSNEQALQSATVLPAEMLGMERSIGAVAPGYFADIAAVEGDPLADIEVAITKVRWVMKAGAVVVDRR
ncbi:MAG: amidohydrolase family protein [Alphaproteobacteria bacterium]|nr:amidohydrolase family protein [Alphaproteobacteria bacterium]